MFNAKIRAEVSDMNYYRSLRKAGKISQYEYARRIAETARMIEIIAKEEMEFFKDVTEEDTEELTRNEFLELIAEEVETYEE